jgi:hypothetical protein
MTNEADFAQVDSMIEQMMTELTSKDLLAEPFAEMARAVYFYSKIIYLVSDLAVAAQK